MTHRPARSSIIASGEARGFARVSPADLGDDDGSARPPVESQAGAAR
jgi:hypothetical protein